MKNNLERIIIVGNGFDVNLGIKSTYLDFLDYIITEKDLQSNEEIYNFNKLFIREFDGEQINWCDFETMFEDHILEINERKEENPLAYTKSFLVNQLNQDLKLLEKIFSKYLKKEYARWINQPSLQNSVINSFYKELFSSKEEQEISLITFNYTNSIQFILDKISNRKDLKKERENFKTYQLHGSLNDENIIFGGGFTGNEQSTGLIVNGSTENDKLVRIKKDAMLFSARENIMNKLENIKQFELFLLGHSLVGSDFIFLQPFIKKAKKIYLFYYYQDYSSKLQFIIKKLGKDIAEKINLVPFFDVLKLENDESVLSGLEQYELIKTMFNFPIPPIDNIDQNSDEHPLFEYFDISPDSFLLKKISQIKIERHADCEKIIQIFEKINIDNLVFEDSFSISIKGIKDKADQKIFSKLFNNNLFQKALEYVEKMEIVDCEFELSILFNGLEKTPRLKQLILLQNTIHSTENQCDLSKISDIETLEIQENSFYTSSECLTITSEKKLKFVTLDIVKNEYLTVDSKFINSLYMAKYIALEIDTLNQVLKFPRVNTLEIIGKTLGDNETETPMLPELKISSSIRNLKISSFKIENVSLSNMFEYSEGKKNILPNLQSIEFNNLECSQDSFIESNIFCNIFDQNPYLLIEDKKYLFSELFQKIDGLKIKILSEEFEEYVINKSTEEVNLNERSKEYVLENNTLREEFNDRAEKLVQHFSDQWAVPLEIVQFAVSSYDPERDRQIGEVEIKKHSSYDEFIQRSGNKLSKLEYSKQLRDGYKQLINDVGETTSEKEGI